MLSVADRIELAELSHRYAHFVDRREFELLAGVFTTDAELVMPDPPDTLGPITSLTGRRAIIDSMHHLTDIPVTLHAVLGSVLVPGPAPELATGSVTAEAHHLTNHRDQHRDLVWYLHYEDRYRRQDGQWLIARRALQIDWIETRPVRRCRTAN